MVPNIYRVRLYPPFGYSILYKDYTLTRFIQQKTPLIWPAWQLPAGQALPQIDRLWHCQEVGPSKAASRQISDMWGFPKIGGTISGVPRLRIIVFGGLYWGEPTLGSYHVSC